MRFDNLDPARDHLWAGRLMSSFDVIGPQEPPMPKERDFDARPYTADEQRVVDYLAKIVPDIGAGDDPIGFLIASHNSQRHIITKALAPHRWDIVYPEPVMKNRPDSWITSPYLKEPIPFYRKDDEHGC